MKISIDYKKKKSFDARRDEAELLLRTFPDKIPVIFQPSPNVKLKPLEKDKFLFPNDFNIINVLFILRKKLSISSAEALFMYVGNEIPPSNELLLSLYPFYKDDDGFLYIIYSTENVFG